MNNNGVGDKLNAALAVQPPSFVSLSNAVPFQAIARSANQESMTLHADDEDVFVEFTFKPIDFDATAAVSQALDLAHWMPLQWQAVEQSGRGEKPATPGRASCCEQEGSSDWLHFADAPSSKRDSAPETLQGGNTHDTLESHFGVGMLELQELPVRELRYHQDAQVFIVDLHDSTTGGNQWEPDKLDAREVERMFSDCSDAEASAPLCSEDDMLLFSLMNKNTSGGHGDSQEVLEDDYESDDATPMPHEDVESDGSADTGSSTFVLSLFPLEGFLQNGGQEAAHGVAPTNSDSDGDGGLEEDEVFSEAASSESVAPITVNEMAQSEDNENLADDDNSDGVDIPAQIGSRTQSNNNNTRKTGDVGYGIQAARKRPALLELVLERCKLLEKGGVQHLPFAGTALSDTVKAELVAAMAQYRKNDDGTGEICRHCWDDWGIVTPAKTVQTRHIAEMHPLQQCVFCTLPILNRGAEFARRHLGVCWVFRALVEYGEGHDCNAVLDWLQLNAANTRIGAWRQVRAKVGHSSTTDVRTTTADDWTDVPQDLAPVFNAVKGLVEKSDISTVQMLKTALDTLETKPRPSKTKAKLPMSKTRANVRRGASGTTQARIDGDDSGDGVPGPSRRPGKRQRDDDDTEYRPRKNNRR